MDDALARPSAYRGKSRRSRSPLYAENLLAVKLAVEESGGRPTRGAWGSGPDPESELWACVLTAN